MVSSSGIRLEPMSVFFHRRRGHIMESRTGTIKATHDFAIPCSSDALLRKLFSLWKQPALRPRKGRTLTAQFDHSLARVQPLPAENLVQGCPQTVRKVIALGVAGVAVGLDISAKPTHRVSDERRSVSIDADEFSRLLKR